MKSWDWFKTTPLATWVKYLQRQCRTSSQLFKCEKLFNAMKSDHHKWKLSAAMWQIRSNIFILSVWMILQARRLPTGWVLIMRVIFHVYVSIQCFTGNSAVLSTDCYEKILHLIKKHNCLPERQDTHQTSCLCNVLKLLRPGNYTWMEHMNKGIHHAEFLL